MYKSLSQLFLLQIGQGFALFFLIYTQSIFVGRGYKENAKIPVTSCLALPRVRVRVRVREDYKDQEPRTKT